MPFTYASHQAPVLAIKMRWPATVDGTAMVLGSMAPDWAYALNGTALAFDAHSISGVVAFCVPVAVLASLVLRRVSPALFANLPSPRWLPLRELRALSQRHPPLMVTAMSALVGALTHVAWDLFTHNGRWGPQHIAWLRSTAVTLLNHTLSWASVLQYAGHILGAVLAFYLLGRILNAGSFRRWYGIGDSLEPDASRSRSDVVQFWLIGAAGVAVGTAWASLGNAGLAGQIIRISLGLATGLVAASFATPQDVRQAWSLPPARPPKLL
ncbi:MAG TPA: DUF4184 family protein [Acidimicrobiales bacterium]|nr:DUF4184 family protein [Acidimicrobiales bacterium]